MLSFASTLFLLLCFSINNVATKDYLDHISCVNSTIFLYGGNNDTIYSLDSNTKITMQSNGNLVLYKRSSQASKWNIKWQTHTFNTNPSTKAPHFSVQRDGNAVVYINGSAAWSTDTWQSQTPNTYHFVVNNNGYTYLLNNIQNLLWISNSSYSTKYPTYPILPSLYPTIAPTTRNPTEYPSYIPTTAIPTVLPSINPTTNPTVKPVTNSRTSAPTVEPTLIPSNSPSIDPAVSTTNYPSITMITIPDVEVYTLSTSTTTAIANTTYTKHTSESTQTIVANLANLSNMKSYVVIITTIFIILLAFICCGCIKLYYMNKKNQIKKRRIDTIVKMQSDIGMGAKITSISAISMPTKPGTLNNKQNINEVSQQNIKDRNSASTSIDGGNDPSYSLSDDINTDNPQRKGTDTEYANYTGYVQAAPRFSPPPPIYDTQQLQIQFNQHQRSEYMNQRVLDLMRGDVNNSNDSKFASISLRPEQSGYME